MNVGRETVERDGVGVLTTTVFSSKQRDRRGGRSRVEGGARKRKDLRGVGVSGGPQVGAEVGALEGLGLLGSVKS